jgi:hypothetical protein
VQEQVHHAQLRGVIDSISFIASFGCLAAMRLPRAIERQERRSMIAEALEGLHLVRERRWMVAGLSADVVFNFALAALFVEQQHVPAEALSRVDSLSWLASLVVLPIGLVVVGPVAAAIGVRSALLAASALAALALLGVLSVRDVRELRRVEQPPAEEPVMTAASTGA